MSFLLLPIFMMEEILETTTLTSYHMMSLVLVLLEDFVTCKCCLDLAHF